MCFVFLPFLFYKFTDELHIYTKPMINPEQVSEVFNTVIIGTAGWNISQMC